MCLYNMGGSRGGCRGYSPPSIFLNIVFCNGKIDGTTPGLKLHRAPPPPLTRETFLDPQGYNLCDTYRKNPYMLHVIRSEILYIKTRLIGGFRDSQSDVIFAQRISVAVNSTASSVQSVFNVGYILIKMSF